MKDAFDKKTEEIIAESPDNFVIQNALATCCERVFGHHHILCSVSGGADSDVMVDMLIRCGAKDKTDFVFCDTGVEYTATKEHLNYLEDKYGIEIRRSRAKKSIPSCVKTYGVPFWGKDVSEKIYYLQQHGFKWEDEDFETLMKKYPGCKTPLRWWCDMSKMWGISRAPFMKEFIISNPPQIPISHKCCKYAKKRCCEGYSQKW